MRSSNCHNKLKGMLVAQKSIGKTISGCTTLMKERIDGSSTTPQLMAIKYTGSPILAEVCVTQEQLLFDPGGNISVWKTWEYVLSIFYKNSLDLYNPLAVRHLIRDGVGKRSNNSEAERWTKDMARPRVDLIVESIVLGGGHCVTAWCSNALMALSKDTVVASDFLPNQNFGTLMSRSESYEQIGGCNIAFTVHTVDNIGMKVESIILSLDHGGNVMAASMAVYFEHKLYMLRRYRLVEQPYNHVLKQYTEIIDATRSIGNEIAYSCEVQKKGVNLELDKTDPYAYSDGLKAYGSEVSPLKDEHVILQSLPFRSKVYNFAQYANLKIPGHGYDGICKDRKKLLHLLKAKSLATPIYDNFGDDGSMSIILIDYDLEKKSVLNTLQIIDVWDLNFMEEQPQNKHFDMIRVVNLREDTSASQYDFLRATSLNINRGCVMPLVGWNDANGTTIEGKHSIIKPRDAAFIFCSLHVAMLRLFYLLVNGLDPPKDLYDVELELHGASFVFSGFAQG